MTVKTVWVFRCFRNKPEACRHQWESNVELPKNATPCPKCGSYQVTVTKEERRVENG